MLGRYGAGGLTLAEARSKFDEAKKSLATGKSPVRGRARSKTQANDADDFSKWFEQSTRDMKRSVFERDLRVPFGRLKMWEITHEDLRQLPA